MTNGEQIDRWARAFRYANIKAHLERGQPLFRVDWRCYWRIWTKRLAAGAIPGQAYNCWKAWSPYRQLCRDGNAEQTTGRMPGPQARVTLIGKKHNRRPSSGQKHNLGD